MKTNSWQSNDIIAVILAQLHSSTLKNMKSEMYHKIPLKVIKYLSKVAFDEKGNRANALALQVPTGNRNF